jgi:hypothetical protein
MMLSVDIKNTSYNSYRTVSGGLQPAFFVEDCNEKQQQEALFQHRITAFLNVINVGRQMGSFLNESDCKKDQKPTAEIKFYQPPEKLKQSAIIKPEILLLLSGFTDIAPFCESAVSNLRINNLLF